MFVGVDLVKIARWERILEKFPRRTEKIFTEEEIAHCEKKGKKRAESYAALWGAREAAGKALGIGIFGSAWRDAYVTWGEWGQPMLHLAGTFAKRAEELGMKNTHFVDCCGLTDSDDHYTTPRDIAVMSRELLLNFPQVQDYTTIWMENITHVTRQGTSEFGLTNTNKLLRSYDGCIGLKTGSTSKAKFCVSAAAARGGITLIGVVMAGEDSKSRFADAATLLNYGFGICNLYTDENRDALPQIAVTGGVKQWISCVYEGEFSYLDTSGANLNEVEKKLVLAEEKKAPIKAGDPVGEAQYFLNGKKIGSVPILAEQDVKKAGFADYLIRCLDKLILYEKASV